MFALERFMAMMAVAMSGVTAVNIFCDSHTYVGAGGNAGMDAWCQAVCNQFLGSYPGMCPDSLCSCPPPEQPSTNYPVDPRTCPGDYVGNPGTTATDAWCQSTCTHVPPNCPHSMCLCDSPCSAQQELRTIHFDDISLAAGDEVRIQDYRGFEWRGAGALNPKPPYWPSGYLNGVMSEENVCFNAFGRDMRLNLKSGNPFRMVSAAFTGAWQNQLKFHVTGVSGGGGTVWTNDGEIGTTTTIKTTFPEDDIYEALFSTTPGVEDPAFPDGSGSYFALDDLVVCVPKNEPDTFGRAKRMPKFRTRGRRASTDGPMRGARRWRQPPPPKEHKVVVQVNEDVNEDASIDLDAVDAASKEAATIIHEGSETHTNEENEQPL